MTDLRTHTGGAAGALNPRFPGKYRGMVTDIGDPKNLGRLKVRVPAVLGDTVSGWALPCMPYGGAGVGLFNVPPVGAGVWVEFEGGDPSFPIWTGCWWAEGQTPKDDHHASGRPAGHLWRTDSGLMVALDENGKTVTVSDGGANLLRIEVQAGQVSVEAQRKVVVKAPQVEFGISATQPVPLGTPLLAYLNVLAGALNAKGITVPPALPSLLSSTTKTS